MIKVILLTALEYMRDDPVEREELSTEANRNKGDKGPDSKSLTFIEAEEEEGSCSVTLLRTINWSHWLKTFGKTILYRFFFY